jgi:hypothetical protein
MSLGNYFSDRSGVDKSNNCIDLVMLRKLFFEVFRSFYENNYFLPAFGCYDGYSDSGWMTGGLGKDIEAGLFLRLKKIDLWPFEIHYYSFSDDDIFDLIELLYEFVAIPTISNNGQLQDLDYIKGRIDFRAKINDFLPLFEEGYILTESGKVEHISIDGMEDLLDEKPAVIDEKNIDSRITNAVALFRSRSRKPEELKEAIRELGDVLEYMKKVYPSDNFLQKTDSKDLFHILNKFGIRHHQPNQQTKYDSDIFYPWMFYYFLAAVRAAQKLIAKSSVSA